MPLAELRNHRVLLPSLRQDLFAPLWEACARHADFIAVTSNKVDANLSYSSFEDIRKECSWMNGSWVK